MGTEEECHTAGAIAPLLLTPSLPEWGAAGPSRAACAGAYWTDDVITTGGSGFAGLQA